MTDLAAFATVILVFALWLLPWILGALFILICLFVVAAVMVVEHEDDLARSKRGARLHQAPSPAQGERAAEQDDAT